MGKTLGCGVLAVLLLLGGIGFMSYNGLVSLEEGVNSAWAQVENTYQRRADLIPNLVATVKGAADFERETLNDVVEARSRVGQVNLNSAPSAEQLQQFQQAQDGLSSALSRLLVVVERYPALRATQAFRDLQVQLEGTENRITVERQKFNTATQNYNSTRNKIPARFFAGLMGFEEKPYFSSNPGSDEPPKVEF